MLELLLAAMENPEDENKFNEIYNTYNKLVFYIANQYFNSQYDVEDAVYKVLLKVAFNLSHISDIHSPRTKRYIAVITKNTCITILNKRNKIKEVNIDEIDPGLLSYDNVKEETDKRILKNIYKEALLKLSDSYYEIIYLKYVEDLSIGEISNILGISSNNASQRLWKAKQMLGKLIKEEFDSE